MDVEPAPAVTVRGTEEIRALAGTDLGPSPWVEVSQTRVDEFAATVDDRHWIHNDPEAARRGPFGGTIGHAHLTLALLPSLFRSVLRFGDTSSGMFYGYDRVRFPTAVPCGSRIRLVGRVRRVDDVAGGQQITVECTVEMEGSERPGCVAEAIWRHYPLPEPG